MEGRAVIQMGDSGVIQITTSPFEREAGITPKRQIDLERVLPELQVRLLYPHDLPPAHVHEHVAREWRLPIPVDLDNPDPTGRESRAFPGQGRRHSGTALRLS